MAHIRTITGVLAGLFATATFLRGPLGLAFAGQQVQGPIVTGNPAPTPEQIRALTARALENQHRDDSALEEYERIEHSVTHKGDNQGIAVDITERRVPSPAGDIKLKTAENGAPVSAEEYRKELEFAVNALQNASHPDDRYREGMAKHEKRLKDRAELVDEAGKAFHVTWAGRETRADSTAPHGQRTLMKFVLDPDPEFKPANRFASILQHVHATIWVDEQQVQFARLEADVATDIPFAGGVAGKVYRGGQIVMEQVEVAPGVWLPTLFSYNLDGRKFVFAFGVHERAEISQYRHIGPPSQALQIIRDELNTLSAATPAHSGQ